MVLIQAWERLRGYHNWPLTKATVQASSVAGIGGDAAQRPLAWHSTCRIIWHDRDKVPHRAEIVVFEESPLYQLVEGDTVDMRFNPANPEEYYLPGLIESGLQEVWKRTLFALLLVLALIIVLFSWFGPGILHAISH